MIHYALTLTPRTPLFVGGYARSAGDSDGDTAQDDRGQLVPGSSVKGTLREAAFRLVRGAGRGESLLKELFGTAEVEGILRFGPLRAVMEGSQILPDAVVRHHVSLDRATRQGLPGRLFQNRVTASGGSLCFRGEMASTRELDEDETGLLKASFKLADQLGGGRGRGLGWILLDLGTPCEAVPAPSTVEIPAQTTSLTLVLEAQEPLQLGEVKDPTNLEASKDHIDGSAVRGALAAALSRTNRQDVLEPLLGGEAPAVFGNGYPGHSTAIPAPLTLRESKAGDGQLFDEALKLCARALAGARLHRTHGRRAASGTVYRSGSAWRKVRLKRRMVTRTARNLINGRGADGLLFSVEALEPYLSPSSSEQAALKPLHFYVPVQGTPEQLRWTVEGAAEGLLVGGTRSRGFGRLKLLEPHFEAPLTSLAKRHDRWVKAARRLQVPRPEGCGALLALGPVALDPAQLQQELARHGLDLVHGVARRISHGGWNARMRLPRTVMRCFRSGSTWIVQSREGSALEALQTLEQKGLGPGRPDGWGRLVACHPIHMDCSEEETQ